MIEPDRTREGPLILLVDDEPSILFTLSLLLEEEGWNVITAGHGGEALECLERERPDLIITDHMMPYLTGIELIKAIRSRPLLTGIPILLLSAALPAGISPYEFADAYLPKPTDLDELFAVVKKLVIS